MIQLRGLSQYKKTTSQSKSAIARNHDVYGYIANVGARGKCAKRLVDARGVTTRYGPAIQMHTKPSNATAANVKGRNV